MTGYPEMSSNSAKRLVLGNLPSRRHWGLSIIVLDGR